MRKKNVGKMSLQYNRRVINCFLRVLKGGSIRLLCIKILVAVHLYCPGRNCTLLPPITAANRKLLANSGNISYIFALGTFSCFLIQILADVLSKFWRILKRGWNYFSYIFCIYYIFFNRSRRFL